MSEKRLVPCPLCGLSPSHFFVWQANIEVIACQKGCKPRVFAFVVHITSVQVEGLGWADLCDVWNTIRLESDSDGQKHIVFDKHPHGKRPIEISGPYLQWSPQISARNSFGRIAKATGAQS